MEFQIGQRVRLKPEFDTVKEETRGEHFTIIQIMKTFLIVNWEIEGHKVYTLRKEWVDIVTTHIELERLEAAFYEYFENLYDNPLEQDKEIKVKVEELMKVVKSVSINK